MAAETVLIDTAREPGLGLAYSTPSLRHLLNVRTSGMSALPDQPDHLLEWLRAHHDPNAQPDGFAPRAIFGRYLQCLFRQSGATHLRTEAIGYRETGAGPELALRDGRQLAADIVVLALGNFAPAPLTAVDPAAERAGLYHHNAWDDALYDRVMPDQPVTLIGTGLTTVDVVLRLRERGHTGVITAISRRGLFPNRHEACAPLGHCAIPPGTAATARAYLRMVRRELKTGAPWRAVIDSLRGRTNALWLALPDAEKRRFRRHLQRRWDVLRHRMAPPVADAIDRERMTGGLVTRHGHVERVRLAGKAAEVVLRTGQGLETIQAACVVNCSGPDMNYRRVDSVLLQDLLAQGLVTPGFAGGGLRNTLDGALINRYGSPSRTLFALGPARLGTLFESIAVPELRVQAADLARRLAGDMALADVAA
jgi:hydroxyacylglutathione hydrolase